MSSNGNQEYNDLPPLEDITRLFNYNLETGYFTYKAKSHHASRITIGSVAGNKKKDGYIRIMINKKLYYAHRLAWKFVTGEDPSGQIDHKDLIRDNNWFANLRESNNSLNQQNQNKPMKNKKYKAIPGVYYQKRDDRWSVILEFDGIRKHFGSYKTKEEAENVCLERRREFMPGNLL